jgi:hypothetical protein
MNKFILVGLLALSCCFDLNSADYQCQTSEMNELKTAHDDELDEDVCILLGTSGDKTHCCYIEGETFEPKCIAINDDEYENIVRFKKYLRDGLGDDDIDIKCSSKFVSFSLLAALALLI